MLKPAWTPIRERSIAVRRATSLRASKASISPGVDNTQLLVKKEIELAKLEVQEIVTARLVAVAFAAVAGVLGLYLLGFLGVTGAKALELVVAEWLAWLIVSGVIALFVVILLLLAKRKLSTPPNKPERTIASVEETVAWAKEQVQS